MWNERSGKSTRRVLWMSNNYVSYMFCGFMCKWYDLRGTSTGPVLYLYWSSQPNGAFGGKQGRTQSSFRRLTLFSEVRNLAAKGPLCFLTLKFILI